MTKMTLTIMTVMTTPMSFQNYFLSKNLERNNKITIFA